ncbi:hypothetical protein E2C01_013029 [Portunus trituberculatus]|uniref:Uncharacterized protein n=1 Tax=Portunus trituberculatus TaxID=210409 RepID=A0A5B7DFK2_PORTR|nr:hypothetical protein [Portunus trituberculatus]
MRRKEGRQVVMITAMLRVRLERGRQRQTPSSGYATCEETENKERVLRGTRRDVGLSPEIAKIETSLGTGREWWRLTTPQTPR